MFAGIQNNYSRFVLSLVGLIGLIASYILVWKHQATTAVNFIDGDPEFYYYYLQATFNGDTLPDYEWLKPGSINTITHHPAGLSVLLLPFYLLAYAVALLFSYPTYGLSLPFQLSISFAALAYAILGLNFLIRFFKLQNISARVSALVVLLLFFGTTLFQYTIVEPAMSHVYSFAAISAFLFYASRFVNENRNKDLFSSAFCLGMVLLIRPNNIMILLFLPFLFNSYSDFTFKLKGLFKNRVFYFSIALLLLFVVFQLFVWAIYEKVLFSNRYAAYGFDWLHPHLKEVLFGFEAGLFVYTPLAFVFLLGLFPLFKESRFRFLVLLGFITLLLYFFSAYSAYTYFDGLGIRVLVDYYAVFAIAGAKLFTYLNEKTVLFYSVLVPALFFVLMNLVYTYQSSEGILLRAGMTFEKWKYIFLKTSEEYKGALGGMNDYPPYTKTKPQAIYPKPAKLQAAFDYSAQEYGLGLRFDSLNFSSNRIFLNISCTRKELALNSSNKALVCVALESAENKKVKSYFQFRLNETPSDKCCESRTYHYSANMNADVQVGDHLLVYIWNLEKQNFIVEEFSAQVFNYNYQIATP